MTEPHAPHIKPAPVSIDSLMLRRQESSYVLELASAEQSLQVQLSPELLTILAEQCQHWKASDGPALAEPDLEHPYRQLGLRLLLLSDRDMQSWLRECYSDQLLRALWYMNSEPLLEKVLSNMSQRAAEMLLDDLQSEDQDPDSTLAAYTRQGREALLSVLAVARQLAEAGSIASIFAEQAQSDL